MVMLDIEKYDHWIKENVKNPKRQCEQITLKMKKTFPELIRVRGFYCPFLETKMQHWWLKTKEGNIIDPTKEQFSSNRYFHYEEWKEGDKEPTGKCLNCGEYCYDSNQCCSKKCYKEFVESLNCNKF